MLKWFIDLFRRPSAPPESVLVPYIVVAADADILVSSRQRRQAESKLEELKRQYVEWKDNARWLNDINHRPAVERSRKALRLVV